MLSRTAKTTVAPSAKPSPIHFTCSGRPGSRDERDAAEDDQDGADEHARLRGLVEQNERDRDGEERRRADRDRRARRAGVADREREEELREAGAEHAGEQERPDAAEVDVAGDDERQRHHERRQDRQQRAGLRVRARDEREPDRDRHRAEERGRGDREHDRVHRANLSSPTAPGVRLTIPLVADPRIPQLADLLVDRCLGVQPGWQVSVRASPLARPLVEEVARALGRRGAYYLPRINWGPDRIRADLDWALEAPLELLRELSPIERYQVDNEDARLTIRAPEDVLAGADLAPERLKALQQAGQVASRRARSLDVRWAVVDYPTEAGAARAGMSLDEYTEFVFGACLLDWDAEEQRMARIKERFDRADDRPHRRRRDRPHARDRGPRGRRLGGLPRTCLTARSSTARSRTRPRA